MSPNQPEPTSRFLRACRNLPVDRIPVWMMRQAGRYQPSYRAVRQRVGFLELCHSPELIAQVTASPIDEFGFDAAILFSDILIHLPAMGLDLSFEKGEKGKGDGGPKIANPVRTRADVEALKIPDPARDLPYVAAGIRAIQKTLAGRVPLVGFVGGPFTVASYAVEGGSQGFTRLKTLLYTDPVATHALFEKLTRAAIVQLQAQVEAGAQAVQIFESWLGELGREDLEASGHWACPPSSSPPPRAPTSARCRSSGTTCSRSTGASRSPRLAPRRPAWPSRETWTPSCCSGPRSCSSSELARSWKRGAGAPVTSSTWDTASPRPPRRRT
jgi:uroporphyrinogen-III decarboxylase